MSGYTAKVTDEQQKLWAVGYSWPLCIWEVSYMMFALYLWYELILKTLLYHSNPLPVVIGFVVANLFVDFISGVCHWAADTWGKFETPIFGPTLIRAFRMHHIDPQDITLHSFAETCANSSYPVPFVIGITYYFCSASFISQSLTWMIIFGVPLGILTNQCHKWAHMVHTKPPAVIVFLQKSGLIISHEKHHKHHQGDFDTDYCIINGWMNPILEKIGFWRKAEALITKFTGFKPREDDDYWRNLKSN